MSSVSIEPVYDKFKGWKVETSSKKLPAELPQEMKEYIDFINSKLGAKITYVSNGPGRDQIVKF
jgi:adenylosuccinate synthase